MGAVGNEEFSDFWLVVISILVTFYDLGGGF